MAAYDDTGNNAKPGSLRSSVGAQDPKGLRAAAHAAQPGSSVEPGSNADAILYGDGRDEQTENLRTIDQLRRQLAEKDRLLATHATKLENVAEKLAELRKQIKEMQYQAARAEKNLQRQLQYAQAALQREQIQSAASDAGEDKSVFKRGFFDWLR